MSDESSGAFDPEDGLTPEQAVSFAVKLISIREFSNAATVLIRTLEIEPDYPPALNFLGIAAFHVAGPAAAAPVLLRAAEVAPDDANIQNNLANMLIEIGRVDDAVAAYRRAHELDPAALGPLCNLASIFRSRGFNEDAEQLLREALAIDPKFGAAHLGLATTLMQMGRNREALEHMWASNVYLGDENLHPHMMAVALWHNGYQAEAIERLRGWTEREPDNIDAKYYLAAFSGQGTPDRAPDDYVEAVFDKFAESFDAKLDSLGYRAPQLVADAVAGSLGVPKGDLAVLDAGCGTGKCAAALRPYASSLVGVDLSAGMLEKAAKRSLYDTLERAELTAFLAASTGAFDLIASADTLCYFGRLDDLAAASASALRPGGLLIFTVEDLAQDGTAGFAITISGRYAHTRDYVARTFQGAGLEVVRIEQETLRMENALPVAGLVATLRRRS